MAGTLYTYPDNFRSNKVLITAQYSGKKVTVDPDFVVGETDKSSAFLKKFPIGKVSSIIGNRIMLLYVYFARKQLRKVIPKTLNSM